MYLLAPWCFIMYIMFGWPKIIILLKLTPKMSVLWVQATHEQFKMRFVPGYLFGIELQRLKQLLVVIWPAWDCITWCLYLMNYYSMVSSDHSIKLLCSAVFIASLRKYKWTLNLCLPLSTPTFYVALFRWFYNLFI